MKLHCPLANISTYILLPVNRLSGRGMGDGGLELFRKHRNGIEVLVKEMKS